MTDREWIESTGGVIETRATTSGFVKGVGASWPDGFICAVVASDADDADEFSRLRKWREEYLAAA